MPTSKPRGTILYDAIFLASEERLRREVGRKVIVVITDGVDVGSRVKRERAIEAAQKADAIIYSIYYSDPRYQRFGGGHSDLQKMSRDTGGRVFRVSKKNSLEIIFAEIQEEMRSQYSIGYTPTNPDKDGAFPDWIELYNAGTPAVDLSGWFLTDDAINLTRWRFPAVTIEPESFLIVFASEKDIRDPEGELHTNFKLKSTGEYLALVAGDGETVVWDYGNPYPALPADYSYGVYMNGSMFQLVLAEAPAKTLIPSNGTLGLTWTEVGFNDSGWISGTTGVGYDRNHDYDYLINTNVGTQMDGVNTTAYIRVPFTIEDPAGIHGLTLRMYYEDGFIALDSVSNLIGARHDRVLYGHPALNDPIFHLRLPRFGKHLFRLRDSFHRCRFVRRRRGVFETFRQLVDAPCRILQVGYGPIVVYAHRNTSLTRQKDRKTIDGLGELNDGLGDVRSLNLTGALFTSAAFLRQHDPIKS